MPVRQLRDSRLFRDLYRQTGIPISRLEKYWEQAEKRAARTRKKGTPGFYRYVVYLIQQRFGL